MKVVIRLTVGNSWRRMNSGYAKTIYKQFKKYGIKPAPPQGSEVWYFNDRGELTERRTHLFDPDFSIVTYPQYNYYPWWKRDSDGWPIEWITNKPFLSFLHLVFSEC